MANNQIALLAQTPVFDTPFESQGKALQLRQLMNAGQAQDMEMQQKRQAMADDAGIRDVYRTISDPKARLAAVYGISPKQGMALEKSGLDFDKMRGEVDKSAAETLDKQLIQFRSFAPQVQTPDQAAAYTKAMYTHPVLGKLVSQLGPLEEAMQRNREMFAKNPRGWITASAGVSADKLMEMLKGTRQNVNLGNTSQGQTVNAYGEVVPGQTTNTPIGQSADNKASVGASYANAAATREIAKSTRDAASIQRDQATEMKLGDDYRAQSKDFKAVSDAYRQINSTLDKATTSPAATLAAATKFMKLLDPGSVVRESELGMALAATGVFDRATNYFNTLQSGKVLTKNQVADFKNITQQIYGAAQAGQQSVDASYTKQAQAYKLRPEMIVQDLGQNEGRPKAGGPVAGAVEGGYRFKGGDPSKPENWERK